MCMVFHSVKCADADLTCAISRINCGKPQSSAAVADPAAATGVAAANQTQGATQSQNPTRLMPMSRPEVVKIEPVERCRATIMLEPCDVTAHRTVEPRLAILRPRFR